MASNYSTSDEINVHVSDGEGTSVESSGVSKDGEQPSRTSRSTVDFVKKRHNMMRSQCYTDDRISKITGDSAESLNEDIWQKRDTTKDSKAAVCRVNVIDNSRYKIEQSELKTGQQRGPRSYDVTYHGLDLSPANAKIKWRQSTKKHNAKRSKKVSNTLDKNVKTVLKRHRQADENGGPTFASLVTGFLFVTSLLVTTALTLIIMSNPQVTNADNPAYIRREFDKKMLHLSEDTWQESHNSWNDAKDSVHHVLVTPRRIVWRQAADRQVWLWHRGAPVKLHRISANGNYTECMMYNLVTCVGCVQSVVIDAYTQVATEVLMHQGKYALITVLSNTADPFLPANDTSMVGHLSKKLPFALAAPD